MTSETRNKVAKLNKCKPESVNCNNCYYKESNINYCWYHKITLLNFDEACYKFKKYV